MKYRILVALVFVLVLSTDMIAQTYTNNEFQGGSSLAWQIHHDPAGRLTIGDDDGIVWATPHTTAWASVIRFGGAQGLEGLLYDEAIDSAGPPHGFGLARRGCNATDENTFINCVRARWESRFFVNGLTMVAVVTFPNGQTFSINPQTNVQPGEFFSIERVGSTAINFYRSTDTEGERQRVATTDSPFVNDGFDSSTPIEARAVFAPDSNARKVVASERYYCCL